MSDDRTPEAESADDALSWEGDDELQRATSLDERAVVDDDEDEAPRRGPFDVVREMTGGEKIVAALFMVLSLGSAAGWIAVVATNPVTLPGTALMLMYELGEFLAIVGAPLAAFTAIQVARGRARTLWLAGLFIVTLPWPLLLGVLL